MELAVIWETLQATETWWPKHSNLNTATFSQQPKHSNRHTVTKHKKTDVQIIIFK